MPKAKTAEASSLVFAAYPDGPSVADISDPESPWFVGEVVRESYLQIAGDPLQMRRMEGTRDGLDVNEAIARRNFAIRWQQAKGADTQHMRGGIAIVHEVSPTGSRLTVDEMEAEVQTLTGASSATIHRHEWTLSEAWYRHNQRLWRAKVDAAERRQNTCHWCREYVPNCNGECSTCLDALEFDSLQQAAQSERGKRAIEKMRAKRR